MRTKGIVLSTIAATVITGAVLVAGGTYAFVKSGLYDVSATTPDSSLVYWATHQTMENSVARRFGANVVPADLGATQNIAAGGQLFVANCSVCHGRPGTEPSHISQGLNPTPPDLFRATREPDQQENFQFIAHGVKMTGMPAFDPTLTNAEIWSLVAFLDILPGISSDAFTTALGPPVGGGPAVTAPAAAAPAPSGG